MNYKDFTDLVSQEIRSRLAPEYQDAEITAKQVDKLQEGPCYGLQVKPPDDPMGVSLNIRQDYEHIV